MLPGRGTTYNERGRVRSVADKGQAGRKVIASNRKARHDYLIEDTYEAGLALMGTEVKALRMGRANLVDGYATFYRDEALPRGRAHPRVPQRLVDQPHPAPPSQGSSCTAARLDKAHAAVHASGRTIVPLSLYFSGSVVKVEIAVATGKKHYDKRHALRERQDRRETERAVFGRHRGE